MTRRLCLSLAIVLFVGPQLIAQVVAPPPPASYDAEIRFRIRAARNERVRQYLLMTQILDSAGFKRIPGEDDEALNPDAERLRGTLSATGLATVLKEPHVRTVLLIPTGYQIPNGADARVTVQIQLVSGLTAQRQQLLHRQARDQLAKLGFVEKVGYDHRGSTRLFGTLPADQLPTLLTDLRWLPAGWLSPETNPDNLPDPLRTLDPLRVIEVMPQIDGAVADAGIPAVEPALEKLSPDLRAVLANADAAAKPRRMEVIFFDPVQRGDLAWRTYIRSAGMVTIEGQAGQIVTILAPAVFAKELAALPQVATVRLPVASTPGIPVIDAMRPADALGRSNLSVLHAQGVYGQGARVALIDSDYRGLRQLLGRNLPPNIKVLDLTAMRNASLEADPLGDDRPGRGTLAALAVLRAAPQVELVIIRVDPAASYMVLEVARYLAGEAFRTEAMTVRNAELLFDNERLRKSRDDINAERQAMMETFESDDTTQQKRLDLQRRLTEQERQERDYAQRLARFVAIETGLMDLRRVSVVANNIGWMEGLPTDGSGPLATYLDGPARLIDRAYKLGPATWLQAAGDTHGQTWSGPLWDADGNGILEFAPRNFPLPAQRWSRELNFVGWQPHDGAWTADLPAGAKIRLALQWTEAHSDNSAIDPARYRTPLNTFKPMVLRQRDPSGTKSSSDDLNVVARAVALPMLITRTATAATYEHVVEWTVDAPGRFAVRIEVEPATSTAPRGTPSIPASVRTSEVFPRLSLNVLDSGSQQLGRPVFVDFRPTNGGMATPGDAYAVNVVGAADPQGVVQPFSARGAAPTLALQTRPNALTFDQFQFGNVAARGTGVANGFAAGMLGAMLSGGGPATSDLKWLRVAPGGLLAVPSPWLQQRTQTSGLRERAAYLKSPLDRPATRSW